MGITDKRLEEFQRLGMDDRSLWKGEVSEIMKRRRKQAERWLAGRELIRSHQTHNLVSTRNKQRQRPVVVTMAPLSQVEPDDGKEGQWSRSQRGRPEGPQRGDQSCHKVPCRICQKGSINRRKGCSNVAMPNKDRILP